ncbi:MBL fold metallo-hydrolase [Prosthecobacter dejongeii]|uniref:Glyoxylase-like metal-dependent hydrolase (Beta-lactamase superfamily II) n=1 Tax=Prosthecobacter dejongeii TaxID=48465 RepID=A0A7W8DN37_9BACT|nr:MBL fold metallo-hydrolase [Prosthecobacter dejongeii]MBB5036139.1 glyoxylase-like metal-dependent hydrolase (beta-lactamase superfamily II) [Prosthecobacter dejongeii]
MRVHTLDLQFQNTPGLIAAYLVESGHELALIETGPGSTLPALQQALQLKGFQPKDVRHVLVTHIHLDHAGAAGWWAQQGAQVYCHPSAARHLVDPSRLVDSARRVYAEQMDTLWGAMLPAPEDNVTALADGESIHIGETQITAWDTPGHARHHHAFVMGDACFTGDVAGLRLGPQPYLSVTSAPPQFDPPAYIASVDRLLAAKFSRLYLTHFGEVTEVENHLSGYRRRIEEVHQKVRGWISQGLSAEAIETHYREDEKALATATGLTPKDWQRHEIINSTQMCAAGVRLYVEKNASI